MHYFQAMCKDEYKELARNKENNKVQTGKNLKDKTKKKEKKET